jgi:hypothetical protein
MRPQILGRWRSRARRTGSGVLLPITMVEWLRRAASPPKVISWSD